MTEPTKLTEEQVEHDRDRMGICQKCGQGMTGRDILDGERPCEAAREAGR